MNKNEEKSRPVLIVADDHEDILEFLVDDLSADYFPLPATNGRTVLELLKDHVVHLIVTDIMMPYMDGYELCKVVKSDVEYSHIPIVMLTAKNTLQSKIRGLEDGADAYIEKPFSPAHLHAQIQSLLCNRNKLREHFANSPAVHINSMAFNKAEQLFLEKIHAIIEENMVNPELGVDLLAQRLHMSRPTLYRKIESISDLTPNGLINVTRLKKAAALLAEGQYKIYEVAYMVGFSSQTHFGRNFQKQFGMTPSKFIDQQKTRREPEL